MPLLHTSVASFREWSVVFPPRRGSPHAVQPSPQLCVPSVCSTESSGSSTRSTSSHRALKCTLFTSTSPPQVLALTVSPRPLPRMRRVQTSPRTCRPSVLLVLAQSIAHQPAPDKLFSIIVLPIRSTHFVVVGALRATRHRVLQRTELANSNICNVLTMYSGSSPVALESVPTPSACFSPSVSGSSSCLHHVQVAWFSSSCLPLPPDRSRETHTSSR